MGPGWLSRFESGESVPQVDMLLALLSLLEVEPSEFFKGFETTAAPAFTGRELYAIAKDDDLLVHFNYARHDAVYRLSNATLDQFDDVLQRLRHGLSLLAEEGTAHEAVKTNAVATAFLRAAEIWPDANPSDLWWFVVYRAYCDPFNHPARFARLDFTQSWKRIGGWALEEILVRFYGPYLAKNGVIIEIALGERKESLLNQLAVAERLEPDKVDVLLSGRVRGRPACFGAVHVKSSFAERRTDDVPLSRALVEGGYTSPLWTMDCKSMPGKNPVNKGELGVALDDGGDRRSAKRKDIEDDGYFSACFSYNERTVPTPAAQPAKARVVVCNFKNPNDAFSRFVIKRWKEFRKRAGSLGGQR